MRKSKQFAGSPPPPWIEYLEENTLSEVWQQSLVSQWIYKTWMPFWINLSISEKQEYLTYHQLPSESWIHLITSFTHNYLSNRRSSNEKITSQKTLFDLPPPWVKYPGKEPWWGGWKQGFSEFWLHVEWLPFWQNSTVAERDEYLEKYLPPDNFWRDYVMEHWL